MMKKNLLLKRLVIEDIKLAGVRYCVHCGASCSDNVDDECPNCGENPDK